jgi:hypothetical protein
MLQVDPEKRIAVVELLSHPWLTLGILDPVDYSSMDLRKCDNDCVNVMAAYYETSPERMWRHLKKWKYDYHTATYFLLLSRKKKGASLRLNALPGQIYLKMRLDETPVKKPQPKPLTIIQGKDLKCKSPVTTPYYDCEADVENVCPSNVEDGVDAKFAEPFKPATVRRPVKRLRSPTLGSDSSPGNESSTFGKYLLSRKLLLLVEGPLLLSVHDNLLLHVQSFAPPYRLSQFRGPDRRLHVHIFLVLVVLHRLVERVTVDHLEMAELERRYGLTGGGFF